MLVASNENRIKNLGINEYFFLTENLEFADESEIQSAVGFIITNKKKNLQRTVRSVIENELDETEKTVIRLFYYSGLDTLSISKKCSLARSTVYRNLKSGLKKIENPLRYVLEYDGYFSDMSADELVKCVKGELS